MIINYDIHYIIIMKQTQLNKWLLKHFYYKLSQFKLLSLLFLFSFIGLCIVWYWGKIIPSTWLLELFHVGFCQNVQPGWVALCCCVVGICPLYLTWKWPTVVLPCSLLRYWPSGTFIVAGYLCQFNVTLLRCEKISNVPLQ